MGIFQLLGKVVTSVEEMWEHDAGCRVSAACVQKRMEIVFDEGYHSHSGTMDGEYGRFKGLNMDVSAL